MLRYGVKFLYHTAVLYTAEESEPKVRFDRTSLSKKAVTFKLEALWMFKELKR